MVCGALEQVLPGWNFLHLPKLVHCLAEFLAPSVSKLPNRALLGLPAVIYGRHPSPGLPGNNSDFTWMPDSSWNSSAQGNLESARDRLILSILDFVQAESSPAWTLSHHCAVLSLFSCLFSTDPTPQPSLDLGKQITERPQQQTWDHMPNNASLSVHHPSGSSSMAISQYMTVNPKAPWEELNTFHLVPWSLLIRGTGGVESLKVIVLIYGTCLWVGLLTVVALK